MRKCPGPTGKDWLIQIGETVKDVGQIRFQQSQNSIFLLQAGSYRQQSQAEDIEYFGGIEDLDCHLQSFDAILMYHCAV